MKKITFFSLYFSEGAPIGFIWWALPAILSKQGFSVTETAYISAIATLPWTFKFIFAPMIDLISLNYLSLKKQLLIYQLVMGAILYKLIWAIQASEMNAILLILVCHGIFAALQDICIDAMAINNIPNDEMGRMNGIMQTGMLVGRSIFGGAGVFLCYRFGFDILIYFLIGSVWISLIILQNSKFESKEVKHLSTKQYLLDFYELVKNKSFWILIVITYFAGFSYNGISTVSSAVLSKVGSTPMIHGLTYSLLLPISMSIGALIGGIYSDKLNPIKVLKTSLLFSILSSIIVGLIIDYSPSLYTIIGSYILFYFFIGTSTTSLYGFLMKFTSKEFAALEFSIFMGIVNFCDSSTGLLTGRLLESQNYTVTTSIIGFICIISFYFLNLHQKNTKANI